MTVGACVFIAAVIAICARGAWLDWHLNDPPSAEEIQAINDYAKRIVPLPTDPPTRERTTQ